MSTAQAHPADVTRKAVALLGEGRSHRYIASKLKVSLAWVSKVRAATGARKPPPDAKAEVDSFAVHTARISAHRPANSNVKALLFGLPRGWIKLGKLGLLRREPS